MSATRRPSTSPHTRCGIGLGLCGKESCVTWPGAAVGRCRAGFRLAECLDRRGRYPGSRSQRAVWRRRRPFTGAGRRSRLPRPDRPEPRQRRPGHTEGWRRPGGSQWEAKNQHSTRRGPVTSGGRCGRAGLLCWLGGPGQQVEGAVGGTGGGINSGLLTRRLDRPLRGARLMLPAPSRGSALSRRAALAGTSIQTLV